MGTENKMRLDDSTKNVENIFLIIFVLIGALLIGSITMIYRTESSTYLEKTRTSERQNIVMHQELIGKEFKAIFSDLKFLSGQYDLKHELHSFSNYDLKELMDREFLHFSEHKEIYDQVRYLDETGMEISRVNFNKGNPEIVPQDKLQLKRDRYYFAETVKLEKDQIYVSPFDLNVENGQIETPTKPMIRFGTPVYDESGRKSGAIILNYSGNELIHGIKIMGSMAQGTLLLVNADGYWLRGFDPEDEWGFMYEDKKNRRFQFEFPAEWERINSAYSVQFRTRNGMFTATTIVPLQEGMKSGSGLDYDFDKSDKQLHGEKYYWKMVSYIPEKELNYTTDSFIVKLIALGTILFVLAVVPSYLTAYHIVLRQIQKEELVKMANFDELTALPNRALFVDRLSCQIEQAKRYNKRFALLFLDLDGFKDVNDSLGHDAGDTVLKKVAGRLTDTVRKSDTAARLGGDEFTIILSEVSKIENVEYIARKIINNISIPMIIEGDQVVIGASIGITMYTGCDETVESLIKEADEAMYLSKNSGKNTYRIFIKDEQICETDSNGIRGLGNGVKSLIPQTASGFMLIDV